MRRSRTEMAAAHDYGNGTPAAAAAADTCNSSPLQARIDRSHQAAVLYRAGKYAEAAHLYRSALTDAACNDPAVVVLESAMLASTNGSRRAGGRGGADGIGGGMGNSSGGGEERLELDHLLDLLNRAATAHNAGLAQAAANAAASAALAASAASAASASAPTPDDPLPSYRKSAALYRLCHALVSSGRVREAPLVEREGLSNHNNNDTGTGRRLICAEIHAARSLLATAEALAQRSDVDGTIHCHEEIVSFLLGDDSANDNDNDDNGDNDNGGDPDDGDAEDQNSLLDDGGSMVEDVDNSDVAARPTATEEDDGADADADADADQNDDDGDGDLDPPARRLSPSSASSSTAGGDDHDHDNDEDGDVSASAGPTNSANANTNANAAHRVRTSMRTAAPPLFVTMNEHQRMRLISNSLNALGNLYSRRGDDEDAIASFTDALDLLRSIEDPVGIVDDDAYVPMAASNSNDDIIHNASATTEIDIRDDIARTLLSLSTLHGRRGELDDAIEYGEEALAVLTERHGDSDASTREEEGRDGPNRHPAVLSALHALGRLYDLDGDFDNAMACYEDSFLGRCKTVGSDDICVADVLVDMSSALQRSGNNVDGALELNAQALRIYRLLLTQGDGDGRAEGANQRAHQRKCKVCLAGTLQNRGAMYMEKNSYDEALICYADAMEHLKGAKGEEHPDVAALWAVMGDANVVGERFDVAKDCYAAALEAHRMRGLEDTESPMVWMLQKIRVIEDIVASAHKEDDEFIEDLATRAEDAPEDELGPRRSTKVAGQDADATAKADQESPQQRARRLLVQQEEDAQFMREIDAVTPQDNLPPSRTNVPLSSLLQEEQAFLAELASGTISDDDHNDVTAVTKQQSPKEAMPILNKGYSSKEKSPPQVLSPQGLELTEEVESVAGPAGIKEIIPQASADDTVSLITFKEEAMLSSVGNGNGKRHRSKYGSGKSQQADWLTNTLGNIVEQADNFLRPLAEHPHQQSRDTRPSGSSNSKGQAPIPEITFSIGGDGQEIARTRSADSDITDAMDLYGSSPASGLRRIPSQAAEEEIGEEIGVEVDELLAQMASAEGDGASPPTSEGQTLEHRKPREARISISSPTLAGSSGGAEHIQVSPTSGKSRKVAKTAEIKTAKKELKRLKASKGMESAEVAACLMKLGSLFMVEGDTDSAFNVWTQELEVRRAVYGAGHFGVADVLNRIGTIRLERDEFELAKNCHTQALEIQQACLGENEHNPDVSRTLVNIGNVYYKERNSLSAIKSGVHDALYDDVVESGMLCRIAFAHDERGEYLRAIHFYDEHVELLKSSGENKHIPGIINALNCLGSLNKKIGRYVEALDYHTKALNMQRAVPKIAKVELANTSVLIGMVKHKAGQFQKALTLFSDALPVQQKAYGKKHSIPGRTIFNMAVTYDELGDYKNCMSSLEQALSIQKSSLPPDHPDTLSTKMYQARIQSSAGKFDYALTALLGVLNSQKQLFGPKHPLVADTLHQIGICYARKGKMNSALKTYEECFSIRKEILGYDHPDIASCLNSIAAVHASKKRNEKALPIYEAALKIRRDALGDQHVDVARTLSNQGVAYAALRDFDRAMAVYNEAKTIREAALGEAHPAVGDSHVNIGNVFLRKCAFSDARREFESALLIYKKSKLPPDDPKLARTMAVIERVKRDEELCV